MNHETRKKNAHLGGGIPRIDAQHKRGKLTARERIALLVDPDSFFELDQLVTPMDVSDKHFTDGVVTGLATIDGRRVALFAQDFTMQGGSVGKHHAQKICKLMDHAATIGCPLISLIDSGGARITEGIHALAGYGEIFKRNVRYSGIIPQISVILGPCAGGAVYSPALTDIIVAVRGISQLFITGPQVIKQVTGETISKDDLGGADVHSSKSGVVHLVCDDEQQCMDNVRRLISYLPSNYRTEPPEEAPQAPVAAPLSALVPDNPQHAYDVRDVIEALVDTTSWCELSAAFAPNIVTGFARMNGMSIGIVANQPLVKAGVIDIHASCKAARFITLCNSFGLPICSLVDVPGYLPGVEQEHSGIIRHGAKLLHSYAHATVPLVSVILRKAFGGAYIVMGSKHLGADWVAAWPTAQIAVLGAHTAVQIIHGKQLAAIDDIQHATAQRAHLESEYTEQMLHPYTAASHGYIDAIIAPEETRAQIVRALECFKNKVATLPKKRSGNGPL